MTNMSALRAVQFRLLLVVWTLGIWGSRLRNIFADDELVGSERSLAIIVAVLLLGSASITGAAVLREVSWVRRPLLVLAAVGIARWTFRGPIILISDEWTTGFKVVHTVLWLGTVVLSILAWREQGSAEARQRR